MSSNLIYTHRHHIIPKHQRGVCPLLDLIINDKSNLIALTVPEHAEAHKKLYEEFGNEYDRLAWQGLLGMIGKEEIVRLSQIENGKKNKGKKRTEEQRRNQKGKKHTEESKRKISLAQEGRKVTEETKRKISLAKTGKKVTEEHKKNMSLAQKGKKRPPMTEETKRKISLANKGVIQPKSPCHRCGMLVDAGNMPQHLRRKVPCLI